MRSDALGGREPGSRPSAPNVEAGDLRRDPCADPAAAQFALDLLYAAHRIEPAGKRRGY